MTNKRRALIEGYPHMKQLVDQADSSMIDIAYRIHSMKVETRNVVISTFKDDLLKIANEL
jgi:hypothetical protein